MLGRVGKSFGPEGPQTLVECMKSLVFAVPWVAATVSLVGAPSAWAQGIATERPSAAAVSDIDARALQRPAGAVADPQAVVIQSLQVVGARSLDVAELIRASGFVGGAAYSVLEMRSLATRMRAHYHQHGYFLAQVYLPAQDITDGVLRLEAVEGQYGQVTVRNRSRLSDALAHKFLQDLQSGTTVNQHALERRLMVISDLPGVQVQSTLTPGATPGTTDLLVDVGPGPRWGASVEADNHGNTFTGTNRFGASLVVNEPWGYGDQFSARLLSSGEGLAYGRVAYQAMLGWVPVGLAYTQMQYQLGGAFASTQSSGTARGSSLFASYPILRSKTKNLQVQWSLESKALSDKVSLGGGDQVTDKDAHTNVVTLRGDFHDAAGTGQTQYQLQWTRGDIRLHSADAADIDSRTARSSGAFDKWAYALSYQKAVGADSVLYLGFNGQWASKNLDASEKFSLGGPGGVRAYPAGEGTGDEGALVTLEWRLGLPTWSEPLAGDVQGVAFVDAGTVHLNKAPWDASAESNTRSLRAAGLGLVYQESSGWVAKAYYAVPLGDAPATSTNDAGGRFWLQASKRF